MPARVSAFISEIGPSPAVRLAAGRLATAAAALLPSATGLGIAGALIVGYRERAHLGIRPDLGVGYWLGIVGAGMMLVLLAYPLRKRFGRAVPGSVGLWFRFHMLLGLLGPLAILYHARFRYDALNSGVALAAMLIVAGSGIVGRYFHRHLYRGYRLQHVEASELGDTVMAARAAVKEDADDSVLAELAAFAARAADVRGSLPVTIAKALVLTLAMRLRKPALLHEIDQHLAQVAIERGWLKADLRQHRRDAAHHLDSYFRAVRSAATYGAFERLFALWHHLHLPLFGFLVLAAITHVVAVHLY
ncbi:hypothetical protein [Sphingomonas sp. PAMC 26617]|uniref:hypothetical protein n=1 Tax=Sphingomonas sp. PAMC 26617 TaxID=1112216 RepID=UPI001E36C20E|nr:hypothetical protein [Sphingomonas sp. PAMC 26617]